MLRFRFATVSDCSLILSFIKDLAVYKKMIDEVVATEELLEEWLFHQKKAEVIFAVEDGLEVGWNGAAWTGINLVSISTCR